MLYVGFILLCGCLGKKIPIKILADSQLICVWWSHFAFDLVVYIKTLDGNCKGSDNGGKLFRPRKLEIQSCFFLPDRSNTSIIPGYV